MKSIFKTIVHSCDKCGWTVTNQGNDQASDYLPQGRGSLRIMGYWSDEKLLCPDCVKTTLCRT